ncbi:hypothetical protein F511_20462 [Dorcoceras hygrometricum]|uniref:Uncharacterized protein n=1 Tax=Dorcoceras hygrometricum TaxID=472368 RepID=A0A2Z7DID9_9LAMI|nr:hypothetical protein F511_20462 [Dorcoceras hygrometricum]
MPTLTRSCDQQPLRATVLPAPATTAGALPAGPTLEHDQPWLKPWANQGELVAASGRSSHAAPSRPPAGLRIRSPYSGHQCQIPSGWTPPDPYDSNVTDLTSNHGPTRENEPLQVDAPAQRRDAPLTTSTA